MKTYLASAAIAAALLATSAPAATVINVTLTDGQENPPTTPTLTTGAPRPASFGTAVLTLNDAMTSLTYFITVFNIDFTGTQTADTNDNLANAHFHAGPAVSPTTNGPVVFGFIGAPFNDNNPNDVVVTPFASGVGGTVSGKWDANEGNGTTLTAQLPNLLAGRAYINFHTSQFPGGELRGNLPAVPEPAAWTTMMAGFAAIGAALRRRRHMAERSA